MALRDVSSQPIVRPLSGGTEFTPHVRNEVGSRHSAGAELPSFYPTLRLTFATSQNRDLYNGHNDQSASTIPLISALRRTRSAKECILAASL